MYKGSNEEGVGESQGRVREVRLLAKAKKCGYLTFHKGELLEEEMELGMAQNTESTLTNSLEKITSANNGLAFSPKRVIEMGRCDKVE